MIFDTLCFSIYSDISTRIRSSSLPNKAFANVFDNSVLPTPVGPKNKNDPIGRFGLLRPTLLLFTALATALTASSCPITCLWSSFSKCLNRSISPFVSCVTGICVHKETTSAASSVVNSGISFCFFWFLFILRSRDFSSLFFSFLSSLASVISPSESAASIFSMISLISLRSFLKPAWLPSCSIRFLAQASSNRSMALSGRKRSLIYRSEREAIASATSSDTRILW